MKRFSRVLILARRVNMKNKKWLQKHTKRRNTHNSKHKVKQFYLYFSKISHLEHIGDTSVNFTLAITQEIILCVHGKLEHAYFYNSEVSSS